jgi:WD40 repeat protein
MLFICATLAVAIGLWFLNSRVGEVLRIDLPGPAPEAMAIAFLPDGKKAITARGRVVSLWDLETGKRLKRYPTGDYQSIVVSPDGRQALLANRLDVRFFDLDNFWEGDGFIEGVLAVEFTPDGKRAWTLDWDRENLREINGNEKLIIRGCSFRLFQLSDHHQLRMLKGPRWGAWSGAFSQDCTRVLLWLTPSDGSFKNAESGAAGPPLQVWDLETVAELPRLQGPMADISVAAISRDGQRLLTGYKDGKICTWDVTAKKARFVVNGHVGRVFTLAFSPDGSRALSGGEDKVVRLWDVESLVELQRFTGHTGEVVKVLFSPDGKRALSSGRDKTIRLWRLPATAQQADDQGAGNKPDKGGNAQELPKAKPPSSRSMTRAQFRQKVMTFKTINPDSASRARSARQWDGINRDSPSGLYFASDFHEAFGKPEKTEVSGDRAYLFWQCADGGVKVVSFDLIVKMRQAHWGGSPDARPGFGDEIALIAINDL